MTTMELVRRAEKAGCEVTEGTKHLKVTWQGRLVCVVPRSPKDCRRRVLNMRADLRRAGVPL